MTEDSKAPREVMSAIWEQETRLLGAEQDKQGAEREALTTGPEYMAGFRDGRSLTCADCAEQQGQEPVAYLVRVEGEPDLGHWFAEEPDQLHVCQPLYTRPAPASQPVGEAVAVWNAVVDEAQLVVRGGQKYLMLTEDMCVRIGTAIEDTASVAQAGLSENAAMDIALRIIANLEDRAGVLDGVDDDTKADIADEIAVAILAAAGAKK